MTRDEKIAWCIEQAEKIEATMTPQEHPHIWTMPQAAAAMWRDMAERLSER